MVYLDKLTKIAGPIDSKLDKTVGMLIVKNRLAKEKKMFITCGFKKAPDKWPI